MVNLRFSNSKPFNPIAIASANASANANANANASASAGIDVTAEINSYVNVIPGEPVNP